MALEGMSVVNIADAIKAALPALSPADQRIATATYRLLATGTPVDTAAVAASADVPVELVESRLDAWPGVFRNLDGHVVGFWGLAIERLEPEYRLLSGDTTAYAWCALDTLFIPGILGETVRVESADPVSGERVSMLVDRNGVREVMPAGAQVSMVMPDGPFGYDVIESFCHRVLFFASEETGRQWVAKHEDAMLLPVGTAYEVGRELADRVSPGGSDE